MVFRGIPLGGWHCYPGKIQLKSNVYQYSVINAFSRGTAEFGNSVMTESAEAKAALADLPEYMQMEAYVSLGKDWTMEEAGKLCGTAGRISGLGRCADFYRGSAAFAFDGI